MAVLNFPDNPTLNQVYTDVNAGYTYVWNGSVWISFESASVNGIRELDNISGYFNGILTTFDLMIGNVPISPHPVRPEQLIISIGGVIQNPGEDYNLIGNTKIEFSTPPVNGLSFHGLSVGTSLPVVPPTAVGVQSEGLTVGTSVTAINFIGAGNTFKMQPDGGTIDVFIQGGGGGGIGTPITYSDGNPSPFSYIEASTTVKEDMIIDANNAGLTTTYVVSVIPEVEIAAGVAVTIGVGKSMIIDVLQLGDTN